MPNLKSILTKVMQKYIRFILPISHRVLLAVIAGLFFTTGSVGYYRLADAQSLQQQIDNLNSQNRQTQQSVMALEIEAEDYQQTIAALKAQIDVLVSQIQANEKKRDELATQIVQKNIELEEQRDILGQNIKAMYVEGDISTIEMLATSKSLSHYLDKRQYRNAVQQKIRSTLEEIKAIQSQLEAQKALQEQLLAEQRSMQQELSSQRAEQGRLLALNQSERDALDKEIRSNNSRIAELRRQQAAENARLWSGSGTRRIDVPDTTGYPWANVQPFPNSYPDPWGMYKRQCVSYTAWKVWKDGKHMPYWGGRGNAKNWANNARAEGIPVHSTPQPGDIAVSTRGRYGHVMYVEEVYGNGTMRISQYNASWDGRYSEAIISTSGLEYVRFR